MPESHHNIKGKKINENIKDASDARYEVRGARVEDPHFAPDALCNNNVLDGAQLESGKNTAKRAHELANNGRNTDCSEWDTLRMSGKYFKTSSAERKLSTASSEFLAVDAKKDLSNGTSRIPCLTNTSLVKNNSPDKGISSSCKIIVSRKENQLRELLETRDEENGDNSMELETFCIGEKSSLPTGKTSDKEVENTRQEKRGECVSVSDREREKSSLMGALHTTSRAGSCNEDGDHDFHTKSIASCITEHTLNLTNRTSNNNQLLDGSRLAHFGSNINQDPPVIEEGTENMDYDMPSVQTPADVRRKTSRDDTTSARQNELGMGTDTTPDIKQELNFVQDTLTVIDEALRLSKEVLDKRQKHQGIDPISRDTSMLTKDLSHPRNVTTGKANDTSSTVEKRVLGLQRVTNVSIHDEIYNRQRKDRRPQDSQILEKETSNILDDGLAFVHDETCMKDDEDVIKDKATSKPETYLVAEVASLTVQEKFSISKESICDAHLTTCATPGRFSDSNKTAESERLSVTDTGMGVAVKTHPDGGWGWVVCFSAFLVQFIALGMLNTAGIVYTELVKEFQSPRGATAWVGSLASGIMFFLGPLTTCLCERFGCRIATIFGGLICVTGLLTSSVATSLLTLYLTYGMMFGSGVSLCYFPTIVVLSKYFKRRIALVNGLVTAGSGVGTLIMGPLVQMLFLRFGVANTFRIVAGIFNLVIICGAMYRPVPSKYSQYNKNTEGTEVRRYFDWSIFRNKGYIVWVTSLATFQLGYFVPFVHLVRHAEDLGVDPTRASFLIGYMSVSSTIGRLFFGKMAGLSCVNRLRMYQTGLFGIALCSFLVPLLTTYGGLTGYAVAFGFFEACFVLLIPLITSDIVGTEKMSYALGSAFTIMAFPMFLGPPIAGWMYDVAGDYAVAFYSCGGTSALAASLVFLIPFITSEFYNNGQDQAKPTPQETSRRRWDFLRYFFGCLWKRNQTPKSFDSIQYSVIITTERVLNV